MMRSRSRQKLESDWSRQKIEMSRLRQKIESNSPELFEIKIESAANPGFYSDYCDWASLGRYIGRNTHLKEMTFCVSDWDFLQPFDSDGDAVHFFQGVSSNLSIKKLSLWPHVGSASVISDGLVFDILTPFFKDNREFTRLEIHNTPIPTSMTPLGLQRLASALGKFDRLTEFAMFGKSWVLPREVIQALHRHPLEKLYLHGIKIERDGWVEFSSLLLNPDSTIQFINLHCITIDDDDDAGIFARGLSGSRSLKEVNLDYARISGRGCRAFFTKLQNPSFNLEKLVLCNTDLTDAALTLLSGALHNQPDLKVLMLRNISQNGKITFTEGWRVLFGFLGSQVNRLEVLDLGQNQLNDDAITYLGSSLAQNSTLKILDLFDTSNNWGVLAASISRILLNPNSALERLNLSGNGFSDSDEKEEALITLATSLENNICLKELLMAYEYEYEDEDEEDIPDGVPWWPDVAYVAPPITSQTWDALSTLMCNASSIMATYCSNHTLQELNYLRPPEYIVSLLELNKKGRSEAARLKIINTHFSDAHSNVYPFLEMNLKVLPQAIDWMGRGGSNNDLNGMYQIVKYPLTTNGLCHSERIGQEEKLGCRCFYSYLPMRRIKICLPF